MKAVTFLLSICFWLPRQVMTNNETEIDNRPDCEKHQDINKALQNVDPFSWMYHRTYQPKPEEPEYACVYANVTKLNGTGNYMFRQGWTTVDNKTVEVPLFVKTERTPEYKRQEDNAMRVTLRNGQACELYVHSKISE
uniref:Putative salivary lipocalin n=1 Tax=Ixodes ricinus TaxID=34613 RepID=A0A0K8RME0_IXORI